MKILDIVFVNWNSGSFLRNCLKSINDSQDINLASINIIIVDNNSKDNSLQNLPKSVYPIRIINNERNMGFGYACNQGVQQGSAPYVLFMNVDIKLLPNTLSNAISFMNNNESIAVLGIKTLMKPIKH